MADNLWETFWEKTKFLIVKQNRLEKNVSNNFR